MGNRFREKVVEDGLEVEPAEVENEEMVEATDEGVQEEEATSNEGGRRKRRRSKAARGVSRVLGGDVLADRLVLKQIPLLLLCLVYLLLIVANRYRVENLSREKLAATDRINYLREHRIQMQKQYQQTVKISQIAETLKDREVGLTAGPPYELED